MGHRSDRRSSRSRQDLPDLPILMPTLGNLQVRTMEYINSIGILSGHHTPAESLVRIQSKCFTLPPMWFTSGSHPLFQKMKSLTDSVKLKRHHQHIQLACSHRLVTFTPSLRADPSSLEGLRYHLHFFSGLLAPWSSLIRGVVGGGVAGCSRVQ